MADDRKPGQANLTHQRGTAPPIFHPDHADHYVIDRVVVHIWCRPLKKSHDINLGRLRPLEGALAPYQHLIRSHLDDRWNPHIAWTDHPYFNVRQWPGQVGKQDGHWVGKPTKKSGSLLCKLEIYPVKYLRYYLQSQGLYDDSHLDRGLKANYLRWSLMEGLDPFWIHKLMIDEVVRITIANLQHMPTTFWNLFGLSLTVDDFKATTKQIDIAWDGEGPDAFDVPDLWLSSWHDHYSGLRTYRAEGDWMSLGAEPNKRKGRSKTDDSAEQDDTQQDTTGKKSSDRKPVWLKCYPKSQDIVRFEAEIQGAALNRMD